MKRASLALLGIVALAGLVGVLAWARPNLVPEWARFGKAQVEDSADSGLFCKEHGVPEKFCTLCHPELKEKLLLCKEHGDIPEDICTLCHPEVAKKYNITELCPHGLPVHFCKEHGEPQASNAIDDGWCTTHDRPEATCTECEAGKPKLATETASCKRPLPLVRFENAGLAETVGIETAEAKEERHADTLRANAETAYDANRYAEISPRVSGFLREVRVDLGRVVKAGEVLAVVDSPEVSAAKSQYLSTRAALDLAQDTHQRMASLSQSRAVALKEVIAARAALEQAEAAAQDAARKLLNLGYSDGQLAAILKARDTTSGLDVVSPASGTVVARHAVLGEAVQATSRLFAVADTATMWLWVDVYEGDVSSIAVGQPVAFAVSGNDGRPATGTVTWAGTEVNPRTRTSRVRAEVANPGGRLRANQFGEAEIRVGEEHAAVVVPREAVQRKDKVDVVFLPAGEGRYRPQRVVARPSGRKEFVEVAWGLKPGERVVTTGAFLLKTEITKGAIGAGCCD
jgi:cobalt-zinc-cadmium efflux system membrane fusion protein